MGKYPWSDKEDQRREERRPKPEKKVYKIKPRTKKGAKEDRLYSELRKVFLEEHKFCEAKLPCCTLNATEVHHKRGRGVWLLIVKFFLPVCHNCHETITQMPIEEAVEKGLSLRRIE